MLDRYKVKDIKYKYQRTFILKELTQINNFDSYLELLEETKVKAIRCGKDIQYVQGLQKALDLVFEEINKAKKYENMYEDLKEDN